MSTDVWLQVSVNNKDASPEVDGRQLNRIRMISLETK